MYISECKMHIDWNFEWTQPIFNWGDLVSNIEGVRIGVGKTPVGCRKADRAFEDGKARQLPRGLPLFGVGPLWGDATGERGLHSIPWDLLWSHHPSCAGFLL